MKLIGLATLGRDAEIRYTQSGDAIAGFSAVYNYGRKDNGGNYPSQWVDCSLWGKRAEQMGQYLTKGRQFLIELDDVHIETYEGKNGQGVKLVGRVTDIKFVRGGDSQQSQQGSAPRQSAPASRPAPQRQQQGGSFNDMDDDIPW